jgi:hypothetical protein
MVQLSVVEWSGSIDARTVRALGEAVMGRDTVGQSFEQRPTGRRR